MYQIIAYLKFLWKSTNQHGVHSPFIYALVTRCFYDRKPYPSYETIGRFRKALVNNNSFIEVQDLGAGSRVFKSSKRKISQIARNAGITKKRARLLNRLIRFLNVRSALEFGTSVGLGSTAIAAGNEVSITTFEGCPSTARVAREHFQKFGFQNIHLETGDFGNLLQQSLKEDQHFDLIYLDGNHQKEPCLEYFNSLLPHVHNDTVLIMDDIHWSGEMTEAWEEIKAHPSVTVSIDSFFWGFIFFRKEQEKEHFIIRI